MIAFQTIFGCFCILFLSSFLTQAAPSTFYEFLIARQSSTPSASGQSENSTTTSLRPAFDFDITKTPFPITRQDNVTFTYTSATKGSVQVSDPFNWLENENGTSNDEIKKFKETQLEFTKEYLTKSTDLDSIRSSIKKAKAYKSISVPSPFPVGNNSLLYLYYVTEASQTNPIYYLAKQEDIDQAIADNFTTYHGTKLFDTSFLGDNQTAFGLQISPDGQKFLYIVCDNTTYEDRTLYIRDISSPLIAATTTPNQGSTDKISGVIGATWGADEKSIFYISIKEDNTTSTNTTNVQYHVVGSDSKEDIAITESRNYYFGTVFDLDISSYRKSIILYSTSWSNDTLDQSSTLFVASLDQTINSKMKWVNLPTELDRNYWYKTNLGNDYYFVSFKESKKGRIVHFSVDFSKAQSGPNYLDTIPDQSVKDSVIVPEIENSTMINSLAFDTDKIYIRYFENDLPFFNIHDLKTGELLYRHDFQFPSYLVDVKGYVYGKTLYFNGNSFNSPVRLYQYDWVEGSEKKDLVRYFETKTDYIIPDDYIVEQKYVNSTDGEQVPIFLLYHKTVQLDGSSPALIDIYGAFGKNNYPFFSNRQFFFAHDFNGILVCAGIRGGDDHGGESWHFAAVNGSKQHSFDDTLAVAKYLIDQKYSSSGKIGLLGEGAGATSASAVINQDHQNLFGSLIVKRGIFDMLRFPETSGESNYRMKEFGNPKDLKAFDWLDAYSPIHNINKDKPYPIILVRPGSDGDDNSVGDSYKYLATLQSTLSTSGNPFFLVDADVDNDEAAAIEMTIITHAIGLKKVQ